MKRGAKKQWTSNLQRLLERNITTRKSNASRKTNLTFLCYTTCLARNESTHLDAVLDSWPNLNNTNYTTLLLRLGGPTTLVTSLNLNVAWSTKIFPSENAIADTSLKRPCMI
jgi:hypothetical protein